MGGARPVEVEGSLGWEDLMSRVVTSGYRGLRTRREACHIDIVVKAPRGPDTL
jgi:hypothetical protein